jgi:hypothetical protein
MFGTALVIGIVIGWYWMRSRLTYWGAASTISFSLIALKSYKTYRPVRVQATTIGVVPRFGFGAKAEVVVAHKAATAAASVIDSQHTQHSKEATAAAATVLAIAVGASTKYMYPDSSRERAISDADRIGDRTVRSGRAGSTASGGAHTSLLHANSNHNDYHHYSHQQQQHGSGSGGLVTLIHDIDSPGSGRHGSLSPALSTARNGSAMSPPATGRSPIAVSPLLPSHQIVPVLSPLHHRPSYPFGNQHPPPPLTVATATVADVTIINHQQQ